MKWTNSYRSFGLKTKRSTGLKTIEHKQGFAFGLIDTFGQLLAMGALPDARSAGHDLAFFNLSNSVGLALAAIIGAVGVAVTGGFSVLFPAAIVCVLASAVVTISMKR